MQSPFLARQALSVLLLLAVTAGQNPAPAPAPAAGTQAAEPAVVLKVTSRLVLVDVVANDKRGAVVTDLSQQDFTILEDGQPQKISAFSLVQSKPGLIRASAQPAAPNPPVVDNLPQASPAGAVNVLLLDGLNTPIRDQKYARLQMLKLLAKLPSDRPIAIFALGQKLRMLQSFTTDPTVLKATVEGLSDKGSPALNNVLGGAVVNEVPPGALSAMLETAPQLAAQVQAFQQENISAQTDMRVEWTIEAMKTLARALAGYPGRKNLIWISSSFPINIVPEEIDAKNISTRRDYSLDVEHMTVMLSDAQIAVYPVDASSLVGNSVYADLSNTDSSGDYIGRTLSNQRRGAVDRNAAELNRTGNQLLTVHATMNTFADRTGGRAFYNTNNIEAAIREGLDDGSTYYSLGYVPENRDWDGKFRKISIKTTRKDVKLRFRTGYYALDPQGYEKVSAQQRAIELGQAVSLDNPTATALPFHAQIVPPSEKTKGKLMVVFAIDPHAISFEPMTNGNQHAVVDCAMQVYSSDFKPVKIESNEQTANLGPESLKVVMQKFYPCQLSTELPAGDYWLRLAVRDARTGLIGSANAQVKVSPVAPAQQDNK
jgi:VWFA-related protein